MNSFAPEPNASAHALDWLVQRHRKGFMTAFQRLFDGLLPDDIPNARSRLDEEVMQALQINLCEWLMAEGTLQVKGEQRRILDHLLGRDGPDFTPGQQAWLTQMGERPLRPYTVTDVRPGVGATLCDALDAAAAPIEVHEVSASRQMTRGMLLGCRVMDGQGQQVLSGALYPFSGQAGPQLLAELQALSQTETPAAADLHGQPRQPPHGQSTALKTALGLSLMRAWLRQFYAPPVMPKFINADSGEFVLLITDYYQVLDWVALAAALAGCADVQGSKQAGWARLETGADGQVRSRAAINLGKKPDRIEPFYRSQRAADEGRVWLDAVAGGSVRWLTRDITDPGALLARTPGAILDAAPLPPALSSDAIADAIEQAMRRSYAHWADEAIPALQGQTPRQAIATAAGLERVKGLLRSYDDNELRVAAQQGRRAISYDFLWNSLGIGR